MCSHCDDETEAIREVVDGLVKHAREVLLNNPDKSAGQHIMGCANAIVMMHADADSCISADALRAMAEEYATVVMRLLALEQMSGISTGT